MSNTGTYKYNPETKQVEKISDLPKQVNFDVAFLGPEMLEIDDKPIFVTSKRQKWLEFKKRGLVEKGGLPQEVYGKRKYFIPKIGKGSDSRSKG